MIQSACLRLSALRAFLGRVHPEMRLIKVAMKANEIVVTVILDCEPSERVREDISEAATEIVADFPWGTMIEEQIQTSTAPLPKEDILEFGWIYERAEDR